MPMVTNAPEPGTHLPWLWLYGPSGVGKSAIGFEVFSRLAGLGRIGYVDLDQIGMCMPAPSESQSAAKADNLLAMLDNLERAGAEGAVVSGDIAGAAMDDVLQRTRTPPVLCRLRADHDIIVERLTRRGSPQFAEASRTYDEEHLVPVGDISVTTHPHGVSELATAILQRLGPWPPARPADSAGIRDMPLTSDGCQAVLITGPRAVGKSMVAWQVYMRSVSAGVPAGYLDLEQLGFLSSGENLRVKLANVVCCWQGLRRHGAKRLVLCGHVAGADQLELYRRVLPALHVVSLTAGPDAILQRARSRARHKKIWLPGDDLFGREEPDLARIAAESQAFSCPGADVVLPTDDRTEEEVASLITCW